jgi:hypothetical protein
MKINWIFILVILLILLFVYITRTAENFILTHQSQYKLIIVKNKNYILFHVKNQLNGENKIYKIYKNKFNNLI